MRTGFAVAIILIALLAFADPPSASAGPAMSFSASQATAGRDAYQAHCSACHGDRLQGVVGPALAGSGSVLKGKTVGFAFNFIAKNMPLNAAGTLSHTEYTEVMAYILQQNDHRAGSASLDFGSALHSSARI